MPTVHTKWNGTQIKRRNDLPHSWKKSVFHNLSGCSQTRPNLHKPRTDTLAGMSQDPVSSSVPLNEDSIPF